MKEIHREHLGANCPAEVPLACPRCGATVMLKFNGGELDQREHCDFVFRLDAIAYDAVVLAK